MALEALDLDVREGEVYGSCWREPVSAHRRVAYVAGEPYLWPSLTPFALEAAASTAPRR